MELSASRADCRVVFGRQEMFRSRNEVILRDPNPLFTRWLNEWLSEAERKNLKSQYALRQALQSLKLYPLPLERGTECGILKGFGLKLCNNLDQKLDDFKSNHAAENNQRLSYAEDIKEIGKKIAKKRPKKNAGRTVRCKGKAGNDEEDDEQVVMSPGSFKVVLLVDTQETIGKSKKTLDETLIFLDSQNIAYEVRRLGAGDFCWICVDELKNELLLPYIIERKRMDDFASSIRDGRFHEQKFRLCDSKVQYLIYLIESYGKNQHVGLPMTSLLQAATNTQIHNRFQIKFTDSHLASLLYIVTLTKILIEQFKEKVLIGALKDEMKPCDIRDNFVGLMKFKEFNEQSSKSRRFTVREIFIKQLLQLKSMSVDKALAITQVYSTPRALISAYRNCSTVQEGEQFLSRIPCGVLKRPIGPSISKVVYHFYNSKHE